MRRAGTWVVVAPWINRESAKTRKTKGPLALAFRASGGVLQHFLWAPGTRDALSRLIRPQDYSSGPVRDPEPPQGLGSLSCLFALSRFRDIANAQTRITPPARHSGTPLSTPLSSLSWFRVKCLTP